MAEIKYKVGDVLESTSSGKFEILSRSKGKALVRFITSGYQTEVDKGALRTGLVKDLTLPSMYSRGFYGDGRVTKILPKQVSSKALEAWISMFKRCYDESVHKNHRTYSDCEVCEEWWDFQNFAQFYASDKYRQDGWQLDKDLLVKGNKLYSPEKCVFLPVDINGHIKTNKSRRGKYLIGVKKWYNKYLAQCRDIEGIQKVVGRFDTEIEAFLAYKNFKEYTVKLKAAVWKDYIDPRAFHAMLEYKVEITD